MVLKRVRSFWAKWAVTCAPSGRHDLLSLWTFAKNLFQNYFSCVGRFISSIRGELVPYLVRKQFSKTSSFQKSKEDTDEQKTQKVNEGSTSHGQCLKGQTQPSYQRSNYTSFYPKPELSICTLFFFSWLFSVQNSSFHRETSLSSSWLRSAPVGTTIVATCARPTTEGSSAAMSTSWTRASATASTR